MNIIRKIIAYFKRSTLFKEASCRKKIYEHVIAHRGFHIKYPENTLEAFEMAINQGFCIEVDVRMLEDGNIVCFHDRYMKRLLGIPGKISKRTYKEVKKYGILNTSCKIPKLKSVLRMVNKRQIVLIEVKGYMNKDFFCKLNKIIRNYKGEVYFHCINVITFFKLKKSYGNRVFYILNPFRRRFDFLKGKDYKNAMYVPEIDNIIVEAEDMASNIIKKIYTAVNRHNSRVTSNHFLIKYKYQIQHRGIYDARFGEHTEKGFEKCCVNNKVIELDVILHNGNVVCYHRDKISSKLGQEASISFKTKLNNAITFEKALTIINGRVPIVIDIKDYKIFNRKLAIKLMEILKGYKGKFVVQSFNPLCLKFFERHYPSIIRGQIGHSLSGLKHLRNPLLTLVNFCLFYPFKPDYIVYDLDSKIYLLSKFNKILGLPVIGYTAKSYNDIVKYEDFFDNIIVEGKIDFKE